MTSDLVTYLRALDTAICQRNEARAEVENLYDQIHRLLDDRAKAQSQADRLREQNYELQLERDEARAEVERLRAQVGEYFAEPATHPVEREE